MVVGCAFDPSRIMDSQCLQWFACNVGGVIDNCADKRICTRTCRCRLGVGRRPGHHRGGRFFRGHLCSPSGGYVWSVMFYRVALTDYTVHLWSGLEIGLSPPIEFDTIMATPAGQAAEPTP